MQTAKTGIITALRESGRGLAGGFRQARLRSVLIVLEVALCACAARRREPDDPHGDADAAGALGFEPDRILSMRIRSRRSAIRSRRIARASSESAGTHARAAGVTDVALSGALRCTAAAGSMIEIPASDRHHARRLGE